MSYILAAFFVLALVCGGISGRMAEVSAAAMEGAGAAVELCLSMAGAICLWSGVMTLMERGGLSEKLARLLRPVLRRILPRASRDTETMAALSANVSANLLGAGQRRHSAGDPCRHADGAGLRRRGQRRAVPPCGAEHRLHPAAAHHRGSRAQRSRLRRAP